MVEGDDDRCSPFPMISAVFCLIQSRRRWASSFFGFSAIVALTSARAWSYSPFVARTRTTVIGAGKLWIESN